MPTPAHTSVLLEEAVAAWLGPAPAPDGLWVDATFGRGGHTRRLLEQLGPQARLLALDRDPQAAHAAREIQDARFCLRQQNFAEGLENLPDASVHGLLLDLGVSSPQLDEAARGFSFRLEGPLDMRMDTTRGPTLAEWLARVSEEELARCILEYGEERFARRVARAIVAWREQHDLEHCTSTQLAQVVAGAVRTRQPGLHPATRTFQALRMALNGELDALRRALAVSLRILAPGASLAVISFHSLEDRMVKQFLRQHAGRGASDDRRLPPMLPGREARPALHDVQRRRAGAAEVAANPRARSAMLRVARRSSAQAGAGPAGGRA